MSMKTDALVRLYPRRWRERYGDELRALLRDTTVTPSVVLDLIIAALREWIRVLTVDPGPAESSAREGWRNFRRSSFATLAMAGMTWASAQWLMRAGVTPDYAINLLMVPPLVLFLRSLRGMGRLSNFQYPALQDVEASGDDAVNPGISRREFWINVVVFGIGLTVWWMDELTADHTYGPLPHIRPYLHWFLLHQLMSWLRSRTKTFLARSRQITLLEARRRRALLPPTPWS